MSWPQAALCYLLGLSSLPLCGSLLFLALSPCIRNMFGTEAGIATADTAGSDDSGFNLGTEGDRSALGTVTSFAPQASSPQWGQNFRSFRMEAQSR